MTSACCVRDLADEKLLAGLNVVVTRGRANDAALLAYLAEVDERRLFLPAACASLHVYCVRVLHMSEDAAYKRITAARTARRFPSLYAAVADGRLHLSAVVMLAPHLTDDNVDERVAAASHRSKRDLEVIIAAWAPRPDVPERLEPLPVLQAGIETGEGLAPGRENDATKPPATRTTPLAPERFALQVTIDQATRDKLDRAQALLRHRVPSGDLAQVIDHALDALLERLVKQKFAETERPRRRRPADAGAHDVAAGALDAGQPDSDAATRHVPAAVRRAVHERDGEQCTFVSAEGVRCDERGFLELDHIEPFAVGGLPTVDNLRLRCRGHNQHAADLHFGRAFMDEHRRRGAARAAIGATASTAVDARPSEPAPAPDLTAEVMLGLRGLGVKPADARDAIDRSAHVPTTNLPDRLRAALQALRVTYAKRSSEPTPSWRVRIDADREHGRPTRALTDL